MQDFQTIAHLLPNFADRVDDPPAPVAEQNIVRRLFGDLLGQSADYIQPVLFRSGRLLVYAEAAIWGQHIQHRHATILERCQARGLHVTEILVKIRPGLAASEHRPPMQPAHYASKSASQRIQKLAAQLDEGDLKRTLSRLAERIRQNHEND